MQCEKGFMGESNSTGNLNPVQRLLPKTTLLMCLRTLSAPVSDYFSLNFCTATIQHSTSKQCSLLSSEKWGSTAMSTPVETPQPQWRAWAGLQLCFRWRHPANAGWEVVGSRTRVPPLLSERHMLSARCSASPGQPS